MSKQFDHISNGISLAGLSADPSDGANGDFYYNTSSHVFRQYVNGSWIDVPVSSGTGTVTSVAASVPAFLSISGSPITTSGTLAISLSGTALPVANGGTGQTSASAAFNALSPITTTGDLIIGTGVNTAGRLAIGANTFILTSNGTTASWAAAPATGVTSVAMSVPSFLSVSGSPITSSGTLAVSLSGTALPAINGGTAQTSYATGDTLYASASNTLSKLTIGSTGNVLTVAGGIPTWAPPATSGTVTSVAMSVPSFLSVSGSPVTSSGTLAVTLSGTALPIANGGTGQTTKAAAFDALSPLTTKGDLIAYSTTNARVAVGTDSQVLTADSTQTAGVKWAAAPTATPFSFELMNLGLACSVASNALTIALKQQDGTTDPSSGTPVRIGFRSSTSSSGLFNERTSTAATSLVVPSGATLAQSSGIQSYLWVYALDNAGTIELAISRLKYDTGTIQSTTTISSGATSNSVIYSTTGRSNVPIRLIARLSSTQTTAGTWAAVPTEISLFDGLNQNEPIQAQYILSANTSTNANVQINYDTKIFDTHNAVTTGAGAWKFTCPSAGTYQVSVVAANTVANLIRLYKNGTSTLLLANCVSTNTGYTGSNFIQCAAGDTLDLRPTSNGSFFGGNSAPYDAYISIQRLMY